MTENARRGIIYGLLATACMTLIMLIGLFTGLSPMPEPIPLALARWAFGNVAAPLLALSGLIAHFAYGAGAGAVFAVLMAPRASVWWGFAFGALLWLIMQVVFLPLLGWGLFGTAITPRIAVATLVLHLIYGGVLGWGVARARRTA